MAKEDEYEILSRRDIRKIRDELKALKEGKGTNVTELHDRLEELSERIDAMIEIFESAAAELREEDKEAEIISKKIDPIFERLDSIDEQNKKIAQGLMAVNNIVEEKLGEITDTAEILARSQEEFRSKLNMIFERIETTPSRTERYTPPAPSGYESAGSPATGAPLPPPPGPPSGPPSGPSSGATSRSSSTEIPKLQPRKKKKHFLF